MAETLVALRKARNLSQEQLGTLVAKHLKRTIGVGYAQKKIARFEAGTASPTLGELEAIAVVLGVPIETLDLGTTTRPNEAVSVIDELTAPTNEGRCLMASCLLSRPRPTPLGETYAAVKEAIERDLTIATFVPYPNVIYIPDASEEIAILQGSYSNIRRSVNEANFNFTKSLDPERARKAIALYFPKESLV